MQEFALFLGIVIAEWITIYSRAPGASGYRWSAIKKSSGLLLPTVVARWAIAWLFLVLSRSQGNELVHSFAWAFVLGIIAVLLPSAFEIYLDRNVTTRSMNKTLIQLLLRFNLLTGQVIRETIQKLKEQDNYDCQHSRGWWNFGLPKEQISRRLRILYEIYKLDIACSHKEPGLLRHDVGIHPNQKFYLLVARLGRKQLRRALEEQPSSPPPGLNWDGRERRRKVGTKEQRKSPDPNAMYSRIYDDEELRSKIWQGKAIDSADGVSKD